MAEFSKFIGDLGEDLSRSLLKRIGWSPCGQWNQDIPCEHPEHKTDKNQSNKKLHGIDGVYSYTNPYTKQDDVLIIEAKALAWMSDEKLKTDSALGKQLDNFIDATVEKAVCALRSSEFKSIFGLNDNWGQTKVVLCYFVRDSFIPSKWEKIIDKITLSISKSKVPIYLVNNEIMERVQTACNFLEKKVKELNSSSKEYFFPELNRKSSSIFWQSYIPVEYLFSAFYLCRIKFNEGDKYYIIYQGSYTQDALRRFFAALGRLQILSFNDLVLVPIGIQNIESQRHGLEVAIQNKSIEVEGRSISLTIDVPDRVVPSFNWKGGY